MSRRWLTLVTCALLASAGCARHRAPALTPGLAPAGAFDEASTPAMDGSGNTFDAYIGRTNRLAAAARPVTSGNVPSIEERTPALAQALRDVQSMPTAENHRRAGEAYRQVGVLDAAFEHLSRAVKLDPTDARAFDELARIWRDWGYPDLGLGDAYRAVYHAPGSPEAYNTLGTLLQALNQRAPARQAYERALALDSSAAYALNNLCYLSFLDSNRMAASRECQSALHLAPDSIAVRNNLGLVYASLGELQSAGRQFNSPEHAEREPYNLGVVQFAAGNYAGAADAFQTAFRANPNLDAAWLHAARARQLAQRQASPEEENHDRH
jgi:Flp pilus assembly protein TadD